jgi:hypothetical protein
VRSAFGDIRYMQVVRRNLAFVDSVLRSLAYFVVGNAAAYNRKSGFVSGRK